MYVVLNRFLLSHQSLDFRRVPEFFKLFYGFDLEVKREKRLKTHFCWCLMLNVISEASLNLNDCANKLPLAQTTLNLQLFARSAQTFF